MFILRKYDFINRFGRLISNGIQKSVDTVNGAIDILSNKNKQPLPKIKTHILPKEYNKNMFLHNIPLEDFLPNKHSLSKKQVKRIKNHWDNVINDEDLEVSFNSENIKEKCIILYGKEEFKKKSMFNIKKKMIML